MTEGFLAGLLEEAGRIRESIVELRRAIHRHPEGGFAEFQTAALVEKTLASCGIPARRVAKTGVAGVLAGTGPGRVVALRADMDALELDEGTGAPYASGVPGLMHACGHDAHTAMLLGAARLLSGRRDFLPGSVVFLFQPAEETTGGALPMIREGVLEDPRVDAVFGLHVGIDLPCGEVSVSEGTVHAASDMFDVTVTGRGCHGAHPHEGVDAVAAAGAILGALQSVVSRNVDPLEPAVVTVGTIRGGSARNVLAETVEMSGIIRTLSPGVRTAVRERVRAIVEGTAAAFGGRAEIRFTEGYPCLVNDPGMARLVKATATGLLGAGKVRPATRPSMGVEDFAYFSGERPGAFFTLGAGNPAKGIIHPAHSPRFDIDEDALPVGAAMMAGVALNFLSGEGAS
jgi:amidohydrolase